AASHVDIAIQWDHQQSASAKAASHVITFRFLPLVQKVASAKAPLPRGLLLSEQK
ncbi:hypothetical protein Tco_1469977, partial [Tanacetum coccineum]